MKTFKDRVAVVTGGASGIGRAMADRFAAAEMRIVLADVEDAALKTAVEEMKSAGAEVIGIKTDVAKADQVEALAEAAVAQFGAVHIVCNNAGVGGDATPSWEMPLETWQWVIGVNLMGVIHGIRSFIPRMIKQDDEGHIVNTASVAGLLSMPFLSPYHVTKHGVVTLSESLHHEMTLLQSKVRVSVLCPGFVNTNIMDSSRNRPAELSVPERDLGPVAAMVEGAFRKQVEAGMSPVEVAELTFKSIEEERFYIFPHPEALELYKLHADGLVNQKNPELNLEALASLA